MTKKKKQRRSSFVVFLVRFRYRRCPRCRWKTKRSKKKMSNERCLQRRQSTTLD